MMFYWSRRHIAPVMKNKQRLYLERLESRCMLTAAFQVIQNPLPIYETEPNSAINQLHDISLADLDGDGDVDILLSTNAGTAWMQNLDAKGNFDVPMVVVGSTAEQFRDLDNDGDLDIWSQTGWNRNENGLFGESIEVLDSQSRYVELADLDEDGLLDVIYANYQSRSIEWRPNLGDATFGTARPIAENSVNDVRDIDVVDIDNDGDLDVVSAQGDAVRWFENTANTFGQGTTIINPEGQIYSVTSVTFDDLDGDTDQDLVLSLVVRLDGFISRKQRRIFENSGSGDFKLVQQIQEGEISLGGPIDDMRLSDLDGDGDRELISISSDCYYSCRYSMVSVFENVDSEVQFSAPVTIDRRGRSYDGAESRYTNRDTNLAVADVDSDGLMDIITISSDRTGNLNGFVQRINWFQAIPNVEVAISNDAATSQVPEDSRLTYLVETVNHSDAQFTQVPFSLDLNVPVGNIVWNCEASPGSVCAPMSEGDRISDLVTLLPGGRLTYQAHVTVPYTDSTRLTATAAFATSAHTYEARQELLVRPTAHPMRTATGLFAPDSAAFAEATFEDITFADLDGDGDQDGLAIQWDNGQSRILLLSNDGSGQFEQSEVLPNSVFQEFYGLRIIDFDSDGDSDFLVELYYVPNDDNKVQLFTNDGFGVFTAATTFELNGGFDVGDLNGDGNVDFAVNETKWINNGDGTFLDGGPFFENRQFSFRFADLNGDAYSDLIAFNYNGAFFTHASWINNGNGEFTILSELPGASGEWLRSLDDVDGDGFDDVVLYRGPLPWPWQFPDAYIIRWNDGSGRFGEETVLSTYGSYEVADYDVDGDLDLVAFDQNDQIFIVETKGDRTFEIGAQPETVRDYDAPAFVDIDGDLDVDIVTTNGKIFRQVDTAIDAISVSFRDLPDQLNVDEQFAFDVLIVNSGNEPMVAASAAVEFGGLTVISWSCVASLGSSCSPSGNGNVSDAVVLAPGGTLDYHVTARAKGELANATIAAEIETPRWLFLDRDLSNNVAMASIRVLVPGDSNHDGVFNSSDLVQVFQRGQYEDGVPNNATFEDGDWNDDGEFDSSDLVYAFQHGGYVATAIPLTSVSFSNAGWHSVLSRQHSVEGDFAGFSAAMDVTWFDLWSDWRWPGVR